jgi:hypothetical protein
VAFFHVLEMFSGEGYGEVGEKVPGLGIIASDKTVNWSSRLLL